MTADYNIKWYEDEKLSIFFDSMPCVAVRYITPSMTDLEKFSVKQYPFICKKDLKVALFDNQKMDYYKFTIPKGYCYDGASIPRIFWRLIGSNTDNAFLIPALIHDVLCEHKEYINYDRDFSTAVFNALLVAGDVGKFKRFLMKNSVGIFQSLFCDWGVDFDKQSKKVS
jgi:hypothetical protein